MSFPATAVQGSNLDANATAAATTQKVWLPRSEAADQHHILLTRAFSLEAIAKAENLIDSMNAACSTGGCIGTVVNCFDALGFRRVTSAANSRQIQYRWEDPILKRLGCLLMVLGALPLCGAQKLLVVSVDGLDQRYLENRDTLGLKIPNLRRFLAQSQWSRGVVGSVPTVTWPSHTTLITGVPPSEHGILGNRRPASEGGDYYWSVSLLKSKSLIDAAKAAGKTVGSVTWPVTVDAPVDYNLPEYFQKRRGGAMDLPSIGSKARPADLVERISSEFPSFAQQWMDDRTRTQAVIWMLRNPKPDLVLVHLVDHDAEAHDNAPFSREAKAVVEYSDELIGQMLSAAGPDYAVALVSDHGFERAETEVNLLAIPGMRGTIRPRGGIVSAEDQAGADWLRSMQADKQYGIGREIPADEVKRLSPQLGSVVAVFEPAPGFWFAAGKEKALTKPHELGNHGHWPTRYRAVFALRAAGTSAERLPEIPMTSIAARLAAVMGLKMPPAP